MTNVFVTPAWLAERLDDPDIVPVEASLYLPDANQDAGALFEAGHIPGAVRFDVDTIADPSSTLPHMLPDEATFARKVGALGLSETMTIVIYDATDLLGGARARWMLTHYGAEDVRLLQGGLRAWREAGFPIESGPSRLAPRTFVAAFDAASVADSAAVLAATRSGAAQVVDARAAPRFAGTMPEPRPGLRSGHIPGARNVPWRTLVDGAGHLLAPDSLAAVFRAAHVDLERPVITSCGSGVSAAVVALALEQLGKPGSLLYDGSWAEWGGRADLPIETGPAKP